MKGVIAVDFDGTCVTHMYPAVGEDIGAEIVLPKLVEKGYRLILYTMRSDEKVEEALKWFEKYEIPIWAVNENPTQKNWTASTKVYANFYIDDAAVGIALTKRDSNDPKERPFVNWYTTVMIMLDRGILDNVDEAKELLDKLEKKYPELYDPGVVFGLNF